jgi:hypothetical protein
MEQLHQMKDSPNETTSPNEGFTKGMIHQMKHLLTERRTSSTTTKVEAQLQSTVL